MNCLGKFLRQPWAKVLGLACFALGIASLFPRIQAEEAAQGGRAVRLGYVDGQVQISQDNQVLADTALANTPLFEGTQVVTSEEGRAEIQFEDGSVARLSPGTTVSLKVLRQQNGGTETELVLEGGLAYFELQAGNSADPIRVRFNDSVATASGFTVMRINLDNPPGELAVFSGNAHLERANSLSLDLHGGESVSLSRADLSTYNLQESIEPDSWDSWNADRDEALQAAYGAKTGATKSLVSNDNPAWADLDTNGNWYNVPGQGYVWSPYEASGAGWDPYGNGNWMWTPRFGYIWVSGDPWGYMPFQCGSWNYYNQFGWGWAPGMGMGSCHPWWGYGGGGGGGWYSTIGNGPGGYRLPVRPRLRPGQPRSPIGRLLGGGGKSPSHPLVPINRRPAGGSDGRPVAVRNNPIVVAGHVLEPLRPLAPRQPVGRTGNGLMNHPSSPIFQQPVRTPGGTPRESGFGAGGHPVYTPSPHPVYIPAPQAPHQGYTPAPRPSGGQPAAPSGGHPYSGGGSSGSRPSGGGSGGGGSHSVGGGGGGGGSHSGGGGGGSHGGGGGGGPHH